MTNTNEEAIRLLKNMLPKKVSYVNLVGISCCYGDNFVYEEPEPYAIEFAIDSIQENTKLKDENNRLKQFIDNQKKLYEYRIDLQLKYNDRNHEEIESLKSELEQSVKLPASIGDSVYVLAECQSISPILDGTLYDSSGGYGTATGYYCPYEDNCPHIDSDCDCEQLQSKTAIFEDEINGFIVESSGNILVSTQYCGLCGNINEYIFLTREEAEQSLEE